MRTKEVGTVAIVLVLIVLSFLVGSLTSRTTTTTTRTVFLSSAGSSVVTEEIIVQPEVFNDICAQGGTNATTTLFVAPFSSLVSVLGNKTANTTTVTLVAVTFATIYNNVTEAVNGTTCTLINPHYNATQSVSCLPCA